jgi:hypothetical protein
MLDVEFKIYKNLSVGIKASPTIGIIGEKNNNSFSFNQSLIYISYSF